MRVIDLTMKLRPGMRGVEIAEKYRYDRDGWNASTLHLYSHCGTHMDSPWHFEAAQQTIDEIPLESCMGMAWVVRLPHAHDRSLITVGDLGPVAESLQAGESLLLNTGWSRYAGEARYRDALPRVSEELAHWCVQKQVKMLGVEPPSVADVHCRDEVRSIHRILLAGGVVVVESLANLEAIRDERVWFAALPLPVERGDGSPVRAFAFEGGVPEAWR